MNLLPDLDPALAKIVAALSAPLELDARAVLIVSASAHGCVVASVRDLAKLSDVEVGGQTRLWELALRPLFFLEGDPLSRLTTLAHELLHLDKRGGILEAHRHANVSKAELDTRARALVDDAALAPELIAPLGHHGWVRLRQWMRRPIEGEPRSRYSDDDLTEAHMCVRTAKALRTTWS